jgi:hypothetical protein
MEKDVDCAKGKRSGGERKRVEERAKNGFYSV